MSTGSDQQTHQDVPPTVFISYSHDSPEHKAWVAGLATDLRRNGVDAILDQWELRAGMDLPTFMESQIREANRVCVVCTPQYARKADAGKGGVGYEKMIVTGELYQNLGSDKFVPLIASGTRQEALPSFLSTRLSIDFSDMGHYQENLVVLLRELHRIPENAKPPLGRNPFAAQAREPEESLFPEPLASEPVPIPPAPMLDGEKVYATCQELLRRADGIGWRNLAKEVRRPTGASLLAWRRTYDASRPSDEQQINVAVDDAVLRVSPLFALALASVEAGLPSFADQRAVMDDLLGIPGWNRSGQTVLVELPKALGYIYHNLHGATCYYTGKAKLALELAAMPVQDRIAERLVPLWREHNILGWPESFLGNCEQAWKYLLALPEKVGWLSHIFVHQADFRTALAAYNVALSCLELATGLADPRTKAAIGKGQELSLEVPPMFAREGDDEAQRAFIMAFRDGETVGAAARMSGVAPDEIRENWKQWIAGAVRFGGYRFAPQCVARRWEHRLP